MGGASLRSNPGLPECECAVRPGYRSLSDSRLKLTAAGKCPLTSKLSLITKFFNFSSVFNALEHRTRCHLPKHRLNFPFRINRPNYFKTF